MRQDTRAAFDASKAVSLVVALMVFGLIAAVGLPVAIGEIEGDTTTTLTQDESAEYEVNAALNSTVTSTTVSTTDSATVELNDTRTSGTTSQSIDNQSTADFDMNGRTVTVGVEDVDDSPTPNQATLNYTYSKDYAYSDGASAIWAILGLVIVLAAFIYAISVGLKAKNSI